MKLGANSLLFGAWDMETAFKYLKMAGYDGSGAASLAAAIESLETESVVSL